MPQQFAALLKIITMQNAEHELDPVPGGRGQSGDVICVCCVIFRCVQKNVGYVTSRLST